MNPIQCPYILMDLDGTITDPMQGITKSVRYALNSFNIPVENLSELCPFIGPPLKDSFKEFYRFTNEQAEAAVVKYREYFADKGIFENELYAGMGNLLKALVNEDKTIVVATSKPTPFAERILEYFKIRSYFSGVYGSNLDGTLSRKGEVIRYAMEKQGIASANDTIMIGDRKHDIIGAKENNLRSVGVLYGYGSQEELKSAGADHIVANIEELQRLLVQ